MPKKKEKSISISDEISKLEKEIEKNLKKFKEIKKDQLCIPFWNVDITGEVVDDIFDELRKECIKPDGKLNIIIDSGGGDIDSAYNLSMLLRKFGYKELNFYIPRWAKSAATLLACSGDYIYMSPVAELGPLDPQITQMNPLEGRLEQFSPLHIESTLDMIRKEFEIGSKEMAKGLMERLQFPLTLGSFIKAHEISEQYLTKLLETRMFSKEENKKEKAKEVAVRLTKGYADHGFCINVDEARNIGLKTIELKGEELDIIWNLYKLNNKRAKLKEQIESERMKEMIQELPPELLKNIPDLFKRKIEKEMPKKNKEKK